MVYWPKDNEKEYKYHWYGMQQFKNNFRFLNTVKNKIACFLGFHKTKECFYSFQNTEYVYHDCLYCTKIFNAGKKNDQK